MYLKSIFGKDNAQAILTKKAIAQILKTDMDAFEAFERSYKKDILSDENVAITNHPLKMNAKQAVSLRKGKETSIPDGIVNRIVDELVSQTPIFIYDGSNVVMAEMPEFPQEKKVTKDEIMALPEELRPQLTGSLMKREITDDAYPMLLYMYQKSKKAKTAKQRELAYNMFRQGLDIQDLDCVTYEIIGTNPNSMGNWLPQLIEGVKKQDFFQIPKTTLIKVPLTLLQLTRLDYMELTSTTMRIVDEYCKRVFSLNEASEYFIKTGTYSSKFDFRNAYVHGEKEVRELGEYLLFIHFQALQHASPLQNPCIYGMSTTNEWCVREYIPDHDIPKNPTIYKGLPLRTEIRAFVDMDTKQVLGMSPYWEPKTMKKRFGHKEDANNPHQVHDYIIYQMHEETLMHRYEKNQEKVWRHLETMLPDIPLTGQWSMDIMLNGNTDGKDEVYIIDMALAANSALQECVPKGLLKKSEEDWIPKIPIVQ